MLAGSSVTVKVSSFVPELPSVIDGLSIDRKLTSPPSSRRRASQGSSSRNRRREAGRDRCGLIRVRPVPHSIEGTPVGNLVAPRTKDRPAPEQPLPYPRLGPRQTIGH